MDNPQLDLIIKSSKITNIKSIGSSGGCIRVKQAITIEISDSILTNFTSATNGTFMQSLASGLTLTFKDNIMNCRPI